MPTWLITGCSTGLGRALARTVLERGWNAVVTARNAASVQDFPALYPRTALALPLDVSDTTQVAEAVRAAEGRFEGVDVLVNNAGHGYRAAVEEGEEEDVAEPAAHGPLGTRRCSASECARLGRGRASFNAYRPVRSCHGIDALS
ncbi:SDR family NAD(P)-dependent oxidoreductase [Streptomyces sp. NPDC094472]|uniref:SDR family NAD(P)-dependent oxidoreductase n=1 Tax=unclassified Streptomyces TaxID=2593676 RepID=UPI003332875D